jgi:hypothetical protein
MSLEQSNIGPLRDTMIIVGMKAIMMKRELL